MTAITKLGLAGSPVSKLTTGRYDGKTVASAFQTATLIWQFDLWREGYAGAVVEIFKEGTTTKADVYEDINLTQPADNPQVLLTDTRNSRTFGKFTVSLYTADSYYLIINGNETTGVMAASLRTLAGEISTEAFVVSDKGGVQRTEGERAGDTIHVRDFGNFLEVDGSTSENTTTLTAALGVASAANGGEVILPAGTFKISTIDLPANVVLRGQGRNATIIQSEEADNVVTVTGDNAGMADMCLDGINLEPGSIGVYTRGVDELHMSEVTIKRFEMGLKAVGGADHHYTNLFIENCTTGANLRGDADASSTNEGSAFTDLTWQGGAVTESTLYGLRLTYVDMAIQGLTIRDLQFTDNVGTSALYVEGAEQVIFEDLIFTGNIVRHILTANVTANDVENLYFRSCEFTASEIKLGGSLKDTVFDRTILDGALSINANTPTYQVMFRDSREASTVTQTGNTDKIGRFSTTNYGVYRGQTTATATSATVFKRTLDAGEILHMEIIATGVQTNSAAFGSQKKMAAVYGPAATVSFDTQTANFTLGNTITGATSGATGVLQAQTDAGVTGTLNLIRVTPGPTTGLVFQDNEAISGSGGGAALVDGVLAYQNTVMLLPLQIDHFVQSAGASTWSVDVTTSTREVQVKVYGVTTGTVDWDVSVRLNSRK